MAHLRYKEVGGVKHLVYTTVGGQKHLAKTCGPTYNCEVCGSCCFSTISKAAGGFTITNTTPTSDTLTDAALVAAALAQCPNFVSWAFSNYTRSPSAFNWEQALFTDAPKSGVQSFCGDPFWRINYFSRIAFREILDGEGNVIDYEFDCSPAATLPNEDWHYLTVSMFKELAASSGNCCGFDLTAQSITFAYGINDGPGTTETDLGTATYTTDIEATISNNNCCKSGGPCIKAAGNCDGTCVSPPP